MLVSGLVGQERKISLVGILYDRIIIPAETGSGQGWPGMAGDGRERPVIAGDDRQAGWTGGPTDFMREI